MNSMEIKNERPPIYDVAKALLDFDDRCTVFTYGDVIYNPACLNIPDDIIAHEKVHMRQQESMSVLGKFGPKRWWDKYLSDPQFRFEQELEAYQQQYMFARVNIRGKERLNKYLQNIARALMSPMYGNLKIGGLFEVMKIIREGK